MHNKGCFCGILALKSLKLVKNGQNKILMAQISPLRSIPTNCCQFHNYFRHPWHKGSIFALFEPHCVKKMSSIYPLPIVLEWSIFSKIAQIITNIHCMLVLLINRGRRGRKPFFGSKESYGKLVSNFLFYFSLKNANNVSEET